MGIDTYLYRPSTKFTSRNFHAEDYPLLNSECYKKFHKTIQIKELHVEKFFANAFDMPRSEKDLTEWGFDCDSKSWDIEFSNGDKFVISDKIIRKYEHPVSKVVVYMNRIGYMRKNYKNSFYELMNNNSEQFESLLFINDAEKISELRSYARSKNEFDKYLMKEYQPGDIVQVSY